MTEFPAGAVLTTIVVVIVLLCIKEFKGEIDRRKILSAMAQKLGLTYLDIDNNFHRKFIGFKLFNRGKDQVSTNILTRIENGLTIETFDFSYCDRIGRSHKEHVQQQTVCAISDSAIKIPHFFLRTESRIFDTIAKWMGAQDINFEEDPKFSRSFMLQGESDALVRNLFCSELRNCMIEVCGRHSQCEGKGTTLVFTTGKRVAPTEFLKLSTDAIKVQRMIKDILNKGA